MGAAWLYVFATIGVRGSFSMIEPSSLILWAETVLVAGAMVFGMYMFINLLRR